MKKPTKASIKKAEQDYFAAMERYLKLCKTLIGVAENEGFYSLDVLNTLEESTRSSKKAWESYEDARDAYDEYARLYDIPESTLYKLKC